MVKPGYSVDSEIGGIVVPDSMGVGVIDVTTGADGEDTPVEMLL